MQHLLLKVLSLQLNECSILKNISGLNEGVRTWREDFVCLLLVEIGLSKSNLI